MISRIQMHGVASYQNIATLETDKKVNVIYGLNGTGKSTISNFLYGTSDLRYARCSVEMGSDEIVLVYNQRFIQEHFYEADSLKGIFSLSKENKDIEEKLQVAEDELSKFVSAMEAKQEEIDTEEQRISIKKSEAYEKTWEIRRCYTGGDRVLEFCLDNLKGKKETLFNHIASLEKPETEPAKDISQIKKEVDAIHGESAQAYDLLQKIAFDEHGIESHEIFEFIIVGSDDSPVAALINKLENSDWVRKGLEFMSTPEGSEATPCPFCQEKTITEVISKNIANYFDESFDDSIQLIENLLTRYKAAAESLHTLDSYKSNPFVTERLAALSEKHGNLEKILRENISAISKKKYTPSIQVTLVCTKKMVGEFNDLIEEINNNVTRHNLRFEDSELEMTKLKQEFWNLMRWSYDQTISYWKTESSSSQKIVTEATERKKEISQNYQNKKNEISLLQKSTVNIEAAISCINNGLIQLGITDFSIAKHSDALYKIVRTGNSTAEFSSLSEGEKMMISFLYFCELCKGKRSATEIVQKKVAVIDDPISSLSHIFVFNVAQMLKSDFFSSQLFEQVFVLTHSLYFFYELADSNHKRRKETQNLFRLTKNNDGSSIRCMKYEEVQNDYQSYWVIVTDQNQPPALIANCMRNIIEYFFNFVQKADLSNVIQKPELQENRYQAFCRYINRESHSLGQNIFDYKEFNYDDFRDGLRLIFEVTGYPEHYTKMTKSLTV